MANPCSAGRSPGLAPGRGLPSRHLSMPLVRSYRTFAPLPVRPSSRGPQAAIGGVFLWHCPHGRPHRALPGRPGHRGARTFLNRPDRTLGRSPGNAPPIAITSAAFQGSDYLAGWEPDARKPGRLLEVGPPLAIGWLLWGCSSAG